jgi:MFS family permease
VRYARWALLLLLLANILNFYDRLVPALLAERIRVDFGLSDLQLGLMTSAATVVYAVAGIPLGRLADRAARSRILGWGVAVWSVLTALNGAATSFAVFMLVRCGVGIGEATCAPAANSLLGDFFPSNQRGRANGVLLLGIPLGLTLAAFTVGPIAQATGNWRAPFFLAAVPGLLVVVALFRLREPQRGASDTPTVVAASAARNPVRTVLAIPTMRWIVASGVTFNFALTAISSFLAVLLQRYFGVGLATAGVLYGVVLGLTGVVGLLVGGWLADRARRRSERARMSFGAGSVLAAAPLALLSFLVGPGSLGLFLVVLGASMVLSYGMFTTVYAGIQDVVAPRLRGTAVAVYFAGMYVLGAAFGPLLVGKLSDLFAAAGDGSATTALRGQGLHDALLWTFPLSLLLTAACMWRGSRRITADARALHGEPSPAVSCRH